MKKFLLEIILIIVGIILLISGSTDPHNAAFLQGMGFGAFLVAIAVFILRHVGMQKTQNNDRQFPAKKQTNSGNSFPVKRQEYVETPQPEQTTSFSRQQVVSPPSKKEDDKKRSLDEQLPTIAQEAKTQILSPEDVNMLINIRVDSAGLMYLCQNTTCPLFGGTIWDIREKIDSLNLSDDQIISLFKHGTSYVRNRLINVCKEKSWTMSNRIFDYLFKSDKMMLLTFPCYSVDTFTRLINQLEPYELLGYRVTERTLNEDTDGRLRNLFTGEDITYYEDVDTDVVYIAEQDFPNDDAVRKLAFDKVFAGPCDLVETIGRLDTLTDYEVKKIFERGNASEVDKMFDRSDCDDIVDYLPPKYAIKVALGVITSENSTYIHDNFSFNKIDDSIWLELFEELTADELAGYRIHEEYDGEEHEGVLQRDGQEDIPYYAEGEHNIMKLIEDHADDDDDLRIAALKKVMSAYCIKDIIDSLDAITENETKLIMETNDIEAVEGLLDRHDSDDIITNLPEDIAIKIRLGVLYPNASDNVKDNYSFNNSGAFIKVIEELSPYDLLGYQITSETTEETLTNLEDPDEEFSIDNNADYDIIKLIEDEMKDDGHLRQLAFEKICGSKNMVEAIARWDNISDDEVAKIIERGFKEEMDALSERSDFDDDVIGKLPDNYIIKAFLLEDNESITTEFHDRMENTKFAKQVETMVSSLSDAKLEDEDDTIDVTDLSDDLLIKLVLTVIDLDDYSFSFNKDEVSDEFVERIESDEFREKLVALTENLK
ncbi:MAG: hypothetical protein WCP92_06115 [bacterium]